MTFPLLLVCFSTLSPASDAGASVTTMDGRTIAGKLSVADDKTLTIAPPDAAALTLPLDGVQNIRFPDRQAKRPDDSAVVVLVDGAEIVAEKFTIDSGKAAVVTPSGRRLELAVEAVAGVLFARTEPAEFKEWKQRTLASHVSDSLVVRRGDKSMRLEGVIGDVGDKTLTFVLEGDALPVNRDRLHSAVFAHGQSESAAVAVIVDLAGNRWTPHQAVWSAEGLEFQCAGSVTVRLPWSEIAEIDLASGRIVYLSDLEPTLVVHQPFFDEPWEICRDENNSGEKLQILQERYDKGLAVHSKTRVEYEVRGFQRFESMVGIEKSAGFYGDAIVRVLADSKVVFEARVRAGEPPQPIAVPLADVKHLALEVDYGEFLDLGDWVAWGNARFIR